MSLIIHTPGDPAGLGPELLLRANISKLLEGHHLLVIGSESILEHHAKSCIESFSWTRTDDPENVLQSSPGVYVFEPPELKNLSFMPGLGDASGGLAAGLSLTAACHMMKNGHGEALVTGPVNKAFMLEAGFSFGGHTEFLADCFGVDPDAVCMHLCGEKLRVSLVTTHPPLRMVPDLVTREKIVLCLRLTHEFLCKIKAKGPVAVCGLNPHAGEQGRIGNEELTVILPALEQARQMGLDVHGPFAADTVFTRACTGEFSAVLSMYHDQGLGPLKLLEFGRCVNVTLGLPIIRTSVDHGTGYDLAGTGKASPRSLERAFELAFKLIS